jgi:hypothetical protein
MKKATSGRARRPGTTGKGREPRPLPETESSEFASSSPSPTAVAAEALRTGVIPLEAGAPREEIPGEGENIRVGDPDDSVMDNEYVGDETPGGSSPTPDQNSVDDIGNAYGLQEEDNGGPLRDAAEILERRDRHRATMDEPPRGGKAYKR